MKSSFIALDASSGANVQAAIDEQILRVKLAISHHFLGNGFFLRGAVGPYAREKKYWYVPFKGCEQLNDGDQPQLNALIAKHPNCTVQAILGPHKYDGYATLCLDADDADGVEWIQRTLGPLGSTVWERTPHGGHWYYVYRLADAPNGAELPKCERLDIGGPGSVDLRTHGVFATLTGSISPKDGSIYGPWMGQWGFRELPREALFLLAEYAHARANALEAVPQNMQAPAPTTATATPEPAPEPTRPLFDFSRYAPTASHGAAMVDRVEPALATIVESACTKIAKSWEGQRNKTLSRCLFHVCRAYRDLAGVDSLPDGVIAQIMAAWAVADGNGREKNGPAEATECIRHTEYRVFRCGKGERFTLADRPFDRGRTGKGAPRIIWGAA